MQTIQIWWNKALSLHWVDPVWGTGLGRRSWRQLDFVSVFDSFFSPVKLKSPCTPSYFHSLPFLSTHRNLVWCLFICLLLYNTNDIIPTLRFLACCFHSFLCYHNLSVLIQIAQPIHFNSDIVVHSMSVL